MAEEVDNASWLYEKDVDGEFVLDDEGKKIKEYRRKSPQQQFFDKVYIIAMAVGKSNTIKLHDETIVNFEVYDYLPAEKDSAYPFVYIGEQFFRDKITKSNRYGKINQTIHIYGNRKQRKVVADILDELNFKVRLSENQTTTEGFNFIIEDVNGQVLPDTSTSNTLQHGILEFDIIF